VLPKKLGRWPEVPVADLSAYYQELIFGGKIRVRDRLLLALLRLLSHPYALVLSLRASCYRLGLLRSHRLPCPVISVGNLTLGGTGKTPMVAQLAADLIGRGRRVAVLSRGYGGTANGEIVVVSDGKSILVAPERSGDEPYLLAQKVPGLVVVIGADRYRAAQLALREFSPNIFILDDGFQHLRLKRDLDILLLDATRPFANGYTLPAGFLREPVAAAKRADLVVYTRCGVDLPQLFPEKPCCWTSHKISSVMPLGGGTQSGFEPLQGVRVTAFSGIASPASFFDLLEGEGVPLTATIAFPDHTSYGENEIAAICRLKTASRSTLLVTTEKDAVKLAPFAERIGPCYVALLELCWRDSAPLEAALEVLLQKDSAALIR
jgi:tetraacyldisaccharide 4'-kinase